MKLSKIYLGLLLVSVTLFFYSCESVTDSTQQNKIQSQDLTIDNNAKKAKVDVCHLDDEGNYKLISIADPALDAHLNHGDGVPRGEVPGQPNYEFDETCTPELVENIPDCFADARDDVIAIAPISELVFEKYSNWTETSTPPVYPNWLEIETPINGDNGEKLQLRTYFEGNLVICGVTYIDNTGYSYFGSDYSDRSFEEEESYLKYLLNL